MDKAKAIGIIINNPICSISKRLRLLPVLYVERLITLRKEEYIPCHRKNIEKPLLMLWNGSL